MYLGIDIGGTKTLLGRFTKDGDLQESLKFLTPKTYVEFSQLLAENIARITTKPWKLACVAAPGVVNHKTGVVEAFGNLKWTDVPLVSTVHSITNCPVLIENDAKLAGLSEARCLRPIPHKVLYLTISTGISGALVVDGVLDPELNDAEMGHMQYEHEGKVATWESFASGSAIVRRFGMQASEITSAHTWKIISHDIAMGVIDVNAIVQPDIVIIGGGVGSHFSKFRQPLIDELKKYESPLVRAPEIIGAHHPEQAVVFGCYELMKDALKAEAKAKLNSAIKAQAKMAVKA